jgi:hypothetical protein
MDLGFALIIQGNLSNCVYFKVLPTDTATTQVKVMNGHRFIIMNCPTLATMRETTTTNGFLALKAQCNIIL